MNAANTRSSQAEEPDRGVHRNEVGKGQFSILKHDLKVIW